MRSTITCHSLALVTLAGVALAAAPACDKVKEAVNKGKSASNKLKKVTGGSKGKRKSSPESRALAAAADKMNAYAHCLNRFGKTVRRSERRYLQWVDPKIGPTGKERHVFGLFQIQGTIATCADKVAKVKGASPSMPALEESAEAFVKALRPTKATVDEASAYYKSKAYTDDGFARGKALHPKLMALFDNFAAANRAFGKAFDVQDDALTERRIEHERKARGKTIRYHHMVLMQRAKHLIRVAGSASPMDLKDLQVDAVRSAIGTFQNVLAKARREANAAAKAFRPGMGYRGVHKAGQELLKAAKAMLRRRTDGKVFTGKELQLKSGNAKSLVGHPAHVMAKYNDLIGASNRLSFR